MREFVEASVIGRILGFALIFGVWFPFGGAFSQAKLDFDLDGISDVVGFENQADGSPNELVFSVLLSSTGEVSRTEFGNSDDVPVPGDYDGDGITDLAVARLNAGSIIWRQILSSAPAVTTEVSFGLSGDTVLGGCDFDGDLKADLAVIRSGSVIFQKSSDVSENSFSLDSNSNDLFYCADVNGDGVDEIIVKGKVAKTSTTKKRKRGLKSKALGRTIISVFDTSGQPVTSSRTRRTVLSLFAVKLGPDSLSAVGYVTAAGRKTARLIINASSGELKKLIVKPTGFAIGRYSADSAVGEGFTVKPSNGDLFLKYVQAQLDSFDQISITKSDTVLPPVNFGAVGSSESTDDCTEQMDPLDGGEGFLWKPVSDTTSNAVVLFPAQFRFSKAYIIKDGSILETLFSGGIGNGNRQHFRSGQRASSFPPSITVVGKKGASTWCWLVKDPNIRYD